MSGSVLPESARVDVSAIRRWCAVGLEALRRHRDELDDLNVFPVPDGDTGTNLVLTMTAAVGALDDSVRTAGAALGRLAHGALLGARGNSGVILAQLLRGAADSLGDVATADGWQLATALDRAAAAAYQAIAAPVEGTVLPVASAAADAAGRVATAAAATPVGSVVAAAARAARAALARTPEQLPDLARAGVVDAGGAGLVVLLDALVEVASGRAPAPLAIRPPQRVPLTVVREAGSGDYAYEVQYLLEAGPAAVARLRSALGALGDSLVVVGSSVGAGDARGRSGSGDAPTVWNIHVHVNDVGAAIEAGIEAGRPYRISVTRFADQAVPQTASPRTGPPTSIEGTPVAGAGAPSAVPAAPADAAESGSTVAASSGAGPRAVVAAGAGDGLRGLLASEGATVVGDDGAAPSTAQFLAAITATGAAEVVVLPGLRDSGAVADAAVARARAAGVQAAVVPTRSPVQALAALAVRDPGRRFTDDVIAMAEAAAACRYAEVTVAAREALTVVGRCRPGDVLALVDGEVNLIGHDVAEVGRALLDRLLGTGGELVTLVTGEGAPDDLADRLAGHLRQRWPFVEVQCYRGGQPHYPILVGVE